MCKRRDTSERRCQIKSRSAKTRWRGAGRNRRAQSSGLQQRITHDLHTNTGRHRLRAAQIQTRRSSAIWIPCVARVGGSTAQSRVAAEAMQALRVVEIPARDERGCLQRLQGVCEMTQAAKRHFETAVFRCANGESSHGVRVVNGPAVCWCSEQADAELIAKALNQYNRITLQTVLEPLG